MATKTTTVTVSRATRSKRPEATSTTKTGHETISGDTKKGRKAKQDIPQRNANPRNVPAMDGAVTAGSSTTPEQGATPGKQTTKLEKGTADKAVSASTSEKVPSLMSSKSTKVGKPGNVSPARVGKDPSRGRRTNDEHPAQNPTPHDDQTVPVVKLAPTTTGSASSRPLSSANGHASEQKSAIMDTSSKTASSLPITEEHEAPTQDAVPVRRLPFRCRPWDARGSCPKGDACPRRHLPPSMRSTVANENLVERNSLDAKGNDSNNPVKTTSPQPAQIDQTKPVAEKQTRSLSEDPLPQLAEPSTEDSKQGADAAPAAVSTSKASAEPCRLYLARRCFYGSRCRFLHVRPGPSEPSVTSQCSPTTTEPSHDAPSSDPVSPEELTTSIPEKAPEQTTVTPLPAVQSTSKDRNLGIADLHSKPLIDKRMGNGRASGSRSIVSRLIDGRPARHADEICGKFQKGQCEYGEHCIFIHTLIEDRRPARETREICKDYLHGLCVYQARCFRYHIDVDDVDGAASVTTPSGATVAEPSLQSSQVEATVPVTVADNGSSHREHGNTFVPKEPPRFVLLEEQMDHRPARVLNTVCQVYYYHGRCKYGDDCERTHALPERYARPSNVHEAKVCNRISESPPPPELPKTCTSTRSRSRQEVQRRPLADVPSTSANLPTPPVSPPRRQTGKGTTAHDLLHNIQTETTHQQFDGDAYNSSERSSHLNTSGESAKLRNDKSRVTYPPDLGEAALHETRQDVHSRNLLHLFFGGEQSSKQSNVGPRLWSSMNERKIMDNNGNARRSRLPVHRESLPSDSSSPRYETNGSASMESSQTSVESSQTSWSSLAAPRTPPSFAGPRTEILPQDRRAVENADYAVAHPAKGEIRSERGIAAPLAGPSRQVNVLGSTVRSRKPPQTEPVLQGVQSEIPLVPPGLGLENVASLTSSDPPRTELPETRRAPMNITLTILNGTRVTYGPGFEVCSVVTGFEPRQIVLSNLPRRITPAAITAALEPFGAVISVVVSIKANECRKGTAMARVTFAAPGQALQAVSSLDDAHLFDKNVTARLLTGRDSMPGKARLTDGDVLLEFPCPYRVAYVGYPSRAVAEEAIAKANGTEFRGNWVTAKVHEGLPRVGSCTVQLRGLPVDVELKDLARYGKFEDGMLQRPNYTSLQSAIHRLSDKLEKAGDLITFNILPPPYKRCTVRAYAHFDSYAAAQRVRAQLHKTVQSFCGNGTLYATHTPMLEYTLPPGVFDALATDIRLFNSYVWRSYERGSSISIVDRRNSPDSTLPVLVKLASQDMRSLTRMKAHFEHLLRGDKVTQNGEVVWDGFFSRGGGAQYLEELERRYAGVLVNKDPRKRVLSLFGPAEKRDAIRAEILAKVAQLRKQKTHVIPLPGRLIGLFHHSDLAALRRQYGQENVDLDPWARVLKIRGEDEAHEAALLAVKRARDRHSGERQRHGVECPVCFDEVTSPVKLDCGHTWCKSCLQGYLRASVESKTFPLSCLGDEARCSHLIPIGLAQDILSSKDFEDVVHASFRAYVHSRPLEYHYCPTRDCEQVYRVGSDNSVLQCPSCLIRICPKCHAEYHEERSCRYNETVSQLLFDEWKGGHDVKDCPKCKTAIEREAGCNHMTCTRCNTHICWACLSTFDNSGEVYEHMRLIHGGIGL